MLMEFTDALVIHHAVANLIKHSTIVIYASTVVVIGNFTVSTPLEL